MKVIFKRDHKIHVQDFETAGRRVDVRFLRIYNEKLKDPAVHESHTCTFINC